MPDLSNRPLAGSLEASGSWNADILRTVVVRSDSLIPVEPIGADFRTPCEVRARHSVQSSRQKKNADERRLARVALPTQTDGRALVGLQIYRWAAP